MNTHSSAPGIESILRGDSRLAPPARAPRRLDALWIATFAALLVALAAARFPSLLLRGADHAVDPLIPLSLDLAWACYGGVLLALGVVWLNGLRLSGRATLLRSFGKALAGSVIGSGLALLLLPNQSLHRVVELGPWMFLSATVLLLTLALVKEGSVRPAEIFMFALETDYRTERAVLRDYLILAKPGLNSLVLVTTFVGFMMASGSSPDSWRALRLLFGTALVAGGASALNQVMERRTDALMRRTLVRPLPAGRMRPDHALAFGCIIALAGLLLIGLTVDVRTAALAALTLATYLFLYTPLKRISTLSTLAGAISGALPPLIGWVGAGRSAGGGGVILFMILFFWQIPHFLAISWVYREQYAAAGSPMFGVLDPRGRATAFQSALYAVGLLLASLAVVQPGMSGWLYGAVAAMLGLLMVGAAIGFGIDPTVKRGRILFFSTIIYLPLLLAVMLLNRV